jgi:hypothetical protein
MAFAKSLSSNKKAAKGPVFCVGRHVFVDWRPRQVADMVPATTRDGAPLDNDLEDGQEVEILSWQPRSSRGLLYEIRRVGDDSEWWIAAAHLRPSGERGPRLAGVATAS